jgi:hypothetical protein
MNYSRYHKRFASNLSRYHNINEQDVLDHPENYLGPNYKEVLNYWFYCESLNSKHWTVYKNRFLALDVETNYNARSAAEELVREVIDP